MAEAETHALILHNGQVTHCPLPDFTRAVVNDLIHHLPDDVESWVDAYNARNAEASQWRAALDTIAASQGRYRAGWYFAYRLAFEAVRGENHLLAERAALNAWKHTIAHTLNELAVRLWQPLAAALPAEVTQLLFVPAGPTALLPVHAAAPAGLTVAYAPSLGIWQQCTARLAGMAHAANRDLFVATPAPDLFFTAAEAEWLADRMQAQNQRVTWLTLEQATVDNIVTQAAGHGIVHFSGHAGYHWNYPLASALLCADKPLTLVDVRQHMDLRLARLVTLSACSTGMSDVFESGEEFLGLPATLLEVGAPAVVASLWPVHDVSTAFLMDRFYELWLGSDEISIAAALQAAAHWLRHATKADLIARIAQSSLAADARGLVEQALERTLQLEASRMASASTLVAVEELISKPDFQPFAEPYYWAAFVAYGAVG